MMSLLKTLPVQMMCIKLSKKLLKEKQLLYYMWLLLQDSDKIKAAPRQQPSSALRAHGCGHAEVHRRRR